MAKCNKSSYGTVKKYNGNAMSTLVGGGVFAGMTPSVGFSDITDGSQSPSCSVCVVNSRLNVYNDLSRWSCLSDTVCRVIALIVRYMKTAFTFYVLSMEGMTLIAIAESHLSSCILMSWFVAAKPRTYCKYCLYLTKVTTVCFRILTVCFNVD